MNKKGFTLIETIMVIAILALLMLILVPNVISLINKNNINESNGKPIALIITNDIVCSNLSFLLIGL